ncbi:hypothetical protein DV737_g3716, partial [Chaetothyriales sp. CBS 132003]
MDPISAAGIGLSVASLALQVFAGCIKGYELFIHAVEMPSKYATMRTQLRIEQSRLLNWGEHVGLLEELLEEQNQAVFLQHNLVVEILLEVHAAFGACLRKTSKYDSIAFTNAKALPGSSPKQSAFLTRARSIWRSTANAGARLEWALVRQDEFEGLLGRLAGFNDRMESYLDRSSIKELHAMQQKSNLLLLQLTEQVAQLHVLAKGFERAATTAPQTTGNAVIAPVLGPPQSLSRSSTLVATEPDQPSLFSSLADFKAQNMSINEDDERPSMLIDTASLSWRTLVDESSSPRHQAIIESRLSNLAYLLNHPTRITLATSLAESLMYLHSVDWLHKGIQSDNILFFPSSSSSPLPPTPVLSGFDFSRPTSSDETTIKSQSRAQDDFYRHPSLLAGGRSTKQHDIYALGIVLVEIALWKPVEEVVLSCLNGGGGWQEKHKNEAKRTKLSRSQIPRIKECLLASRYEGYESVTAAVGAQAGEFGDELKAINDGV